MLSHPLRRAVAACASTLLVLGLVSVATPSQAAEGYGTISGRVFDPEGRPRGYVDITVYGATGDPQNPWEDLHLGEESGYDDSGSHPEVVGTYSISLAPGTYRLGFALGSQGEITGGEYGGQFYNDVQSIESAESIEVVAGADNGGHDVHLRYEGGTISGTVTGVDGLPLAYVEVGGYRADQGYGDMAPFHNDPNISTTTDQNGHYTLQTRGIPVWLYFSQDTGGYVGEYFDNAQVVSEATAIQASTGTDVPGTNAVLDSLPIKNKALPSVQGSLFVGGTARADEGDWSSRGVTYKYQWYRVSSAGTTRIAYATSRTYKISGPNYGKRLKVRVTASQAGVSSVSVLSPSSATVKYGSTISLSGSSPSRATVKMSVVVRKSTGSRASGRVRFSCGTSLVTYAAKTVTLSSGKASATLKPVPKGLQTCKASYSGTSTVASRTKSMTISVR